MTPLIEEILLALGKVAKQLAVIVYEVVIYPMGSMGYAAIYHLPVIGPAVCEAIDVILDRLSQDWTAHGFGSEEGENG